MNRAISLGFLFLLTVSFVSNGSGETEGEAYRRVSQERETFESTLPGYFITRYFERFPCEGPIGTECNFLLPSNNEVSWSVVGQPLIHKISRIELFRPFGSRVHDLLSFNVTTASPGVETIQIKLTKLSNGEEETKNIEVNAFATPAQTLALDARNQILGNLPANHYYHNGGENITINTAAGNAVFILVDNKDSLPDGTPTSLQWIPTASSSENLQISGPTIYWNTAVHGIRKLYSFKVIPTQPGSYTFQAQQMNGSRTMATVTVILTVTG